jgi:pyridoxal phosphate enzyme (YggS family)
VSEVQDNLAELRAAIRRSAEDVGRSPEDVTLVAVSKTVSAERIGQALAAGQRVFGENYVQESAAKWPALREAYPDVELHMVGPLQSNKARDAVRLFDVIHSLDRASLAKALAKEIEAAGRAPRLLVQVNTGDEPQKGGVPPREADAFLAACRETTGSGSRG